jgi:hypothetical protein
VAQRWSDHTGSHRLAEHWDEASMVATAAATSLLDWTQGPEHDPVPYFWSDQFGLRLQYVGYAQSWASVQLEGEPASFVARYRVEDGTTVAALAVNRPTELGALRTELAAGLGPERLAA